MSNRIRDLVAVRLARREDASAVVCHCKHVQYAAVERAIRCGARSIADLQRKTDACTRCFGCRYELEDLLKAHYGEQYRHEASIHIPDDYEKRELPNPMYLPVLAGFGGYDVDTRMIVFNWEGPERPVGFRLDLMQPNAARVGAWQHHVHAGTSTVIDLSRAGRGGLLPDGVGIAKLVLDRVEVGSLRPYFHFETPTSVTTTHEKKGPKDPRRQRPRRYHWVFPIGAIKRPEEAYFVFVHTQLEPMHEQRLIWQAVDGETVEVPLPILEFEQSAFVPLHQHIPAIAEGTKAGLCGSPLPTTWSQAGWSGTTRRHSCGALSISRDLSLAAHLRVVAATRRALAECRPVDLPLDRRAGGPVRGLAPRLRRLERAALGA